MPTIDPNQSARARLVAAGFSDEDIAVLLERATQLVVGLERLAALDAELPEPALIWQPVEETAP